MSTPEMEQGESRTVGLVGLGLLGSAIAEVLIGQDFQVVGFDIDPDRVSGLRNMGGWSADSPAHVAEAAELIVLSLPDSEAVLKVVEGTEGVCSSESPPRTIIDTTTSDPDETTALAGRLKDRGIEFIDATVCGSSQQMRQRDAVLMAGGEEGAVKGCRDILDAMSEKVFHMGAVGSGSRAKLVCNLIIGLNRAALAEGLVFAEKLGFDPEILLEVLKVSPAYSAAMDVKGEKMLSGEFTPQSRIRQHRKDVSLMLKYAEQAGQELPLSEVHRDLLDRAIEAGDGDLDNAAVIKEIRRRAKSQQ